MNDEIINSSKKKNFSPSIVASQNGLVVNQIGKSYNNRPVLRDISLNVQRSEAVGLLGPNGAGKTTSFYIICGLISADYGQVKLDNNDITNLPMHQRAKRGIGYLPQEASIFRGMTVEENIMSILEVIEPINENKKIRLEELLGEFSISHLRKTPAIALSGGERRRVEIARALASNPHIMLLDEPLAGIDPIAVADIKNLIMKLKKKNIGVLITDHNVRETLHLVDRSYIIHDGKVLTEGSTKDIIGNNDVRRVYLGDKFTL